jgi:hypothetical protein
MVFNTISTPALTLPFVVTLGLEENSLEGNIPAEIIGMQSLGKFARMSGRFVHSPQIFAQSSLPFL